VEWVVKLLERVGDFVERPVNILEEVRYFAGGGVNPGWGAEISEGKGFVIPARGIVIIFRGVLRLRSGRRSIPQDDARSLTKTPDPPGRRPIPQEDARSPRMTVSFSFSYSYSFSFSISYSFLFLLSL